MADIPPYGPAAQSRASIHRRDQFRSPAAAVSPESRPETSDQQLQATCAQMESLFLNHLLAKMRSTIEKTDLFGGGRSEEMYTSMLDSEIARNLAEAGGIGLAKVLRQQLAAAGTSSPDSGKK